MCKLERYEDALVDLMVARVLHQELAQSEPDISAHIIELGRTEVRIAILCLHRRTKEGDETAGEWLDKAAARLTALKESGRSNSQALDIDRILESISQNQALVGERVEQRLTASG